MSIIQALIYGIVQGLGEFLPISSTAHLIIVPKVFGWNDPGLTFDVALHLGTLFAVVMFFWKDWLKLIKDGFTNVRSASGKLFWFLVIACIPGGIAGVLFEDKVATSFREIWAIGIALIVMGFVLYIADKLGKATTDLGKISFGKSIAIGISQAITIIPGVSRSGVTIAAGRVLGLTRDAAA
jgi:undecaprenyl-diphosphatase